MGQRGAPVRRAAETGGRAVRDYARADRGAGPEGPARVADRDAGQGVAGYRRHGPRGVLFRTLADEDSSPTREQVEVLTGLRKAYCNAGLWRPQDLGGRIQAELDALSA